MGLGDEIMATAQARELSNKLGGPVSFRKKTHNTREIFKNNPYIVPQGGFELINESGRPYMLAMTEEKVVYSPNFSAVPGDLYFTESEMMEARRLIDELEDFIVIEPSIKNKFSKDNKDWGWNNWQSLVEKLQDYTVVQLVPNQSAQKMPGAHVIETPTFRIACAVVNEAKLFVGPDGGLHHASAALNVPAVVIWGGYSHPSQLGYSQHTNLRADDTPACGSRKSCSHCRAMMEQISVQQVYEAITQANPQ